MNSPYRRYENALAILAEVSRLRNLMNKVRLKILDQGELDPEQLALEQWLKEMRNSESPSYIQFVAAVIRQWFTLYQQIQYTQ